MKKAYQRAITAVLVFTAYLLLLPSLKAQAEFAPIGAQWTYRKCHWQWCYAEINEVVRDTVIDGMSCSILERVGYSSLSPPQIIGEWTLCQEGAKVYHYWDTISYLLYDFDAQPGDSWPIRLMKPYFSEFSDMQAWLHVDSLGILETNGQPFDVQYTSIETEMDLSAFTGWSFNWIIRDVGTYSYILPVFYGDQCCEEFILFCYETPDLFYESPFIPEGGSCLPPVGTSGPPEGSSLRIFPNPASESIHIEATETLGNKVYAITAFRADGSVFRYFDTAAAPWAGEISVRDWPEGLYWLRFFGRRGTVMRKIVVAR